MAPSRCFVRVWHAKQECPKTGHPILVVTYRLAFEAFSGEDQRSFDLVFYNSHARERVLSVGMFDGQLRLALGPETFLGGWAASEVPPIKPSSSMSSSSSPGLKQLVGLEVWPLSQGITVVQVRLAYALTPHQRLRKQNLVWSGQAEEWIQQASFLEDFCPRELQQQQQQSPTTTRTAAATEILLEFKPRLFRCQGLH